MLCGRAHDMHNSNFDTSIESAASRRVNDVWRDALQRPGGMYTNFLYSRLMGIGKESGVTRRDPSTILKINGTYYVWYTRRATVGSEKDRHTNNVNESWDIPRYDWDLSEIYFATSQDGFNWVEQGKAAVRGPRDAFDGRSIFTPDVLMANGRYYLYYQAVDHPYRTRTRNVVGMAWSETPEGPWHRWPEPILRPGKAGKWLGDDDTNHVSSYGEWDSHKVHDPFIICREGKYWLYYKGQPMGWGTEYCRGIHWGVAIADSPYGPFKKSNLNPVTNSGHETCLFPWGAGVLAICNHDGPEKDTIQYAEDGIHFEVVAHVTLPPCAPGPFCADSYSNTDDGRGITWGLAHIATEELKSGNSYIVRFDCDLSRDVVRDGFDFSNVRMPEDVYFSPDFALRDKNKYSFAEEGAKEVAKRKVCVCGYEQEQHHSRVCEGCGTVLVTWEAREIPGFPPLPPSMRRPDNLISSAMERVFSTYGYSKDQESPFFSGFKYSQLKGLGKEAGITRRDPSKVVKIGDTYYVWYTRRQTNYAPRYSGQNAIRDDHLDKQDRDRPLTDWDLSEIWCAQSKDGYSWKELGQAITHGTNKSYYGRSVCTPDILVADGRFYLFFQAIRNPYLTRSRNSIGLAISDMPSGPWRIMEKPVLLPGRAGMWDGEKDINIAKEAGDWDSHKIHDPYVMPWKGKYWLYYKGRPMGFRESTHRNDGLGWGVAVSDSPEGPYLKSSYNPVTNSGHETFLYPLGRGLVAITSLEGPEMNTVQYSEDGINFHVVGKVSLPPVAAGPYIGDGEGDNKLGAGVEWGLAHIAHGENGRLDNSFMVRFDCNLGSKGDREGFYRPWNFRFPEAAYLSARFRLPDDWRREAIRLGHTYDRESVGFVG